MGQSLVYNYVHIVFSTKHRQPLVNKDVQEHLYRYLGSLCKDWDSPALRIGGHIEHVHILCSLSRKLALSKLLEELKANSSKWIKGIAPGMEHFYWQNGYGAFSVNPKETHKVIDYIAHQQEHHQKYCFQQEYRAFLHQYNVAYDERYVWD